MTNQQDVARRDDALDPKVEHQIYRFLQAERKRASVVTIGSIIGFLILNVAALTFVYKEAREFALRSAVESAVAQSGDVTKAMLDADAAVARLATASETAWEKLGGVNGKAEQLERELAEVSSELDDASAQFEERFADATSVLRTKVVAVQREWDGLLRAIEGISSDDVERARTELQQYASLLDDAEAGADAKGRLDRLDDESASTPVVPVGTIIASVLPHEAFLSSSVWVPADGRDISGSALQTLTGRSVAPDLRGVFLRGLNQFDSNQLSVEPTRADPDRKPGDRAGSFQPDALAAHIHYTFADESVTKVGGPSIDAVTSPGYRFNLNGAHDYRMAASGMEPTRGRTSPSGGSSETRPKNVAVYYYIKINW